MAKARLKSIFIHFTCIESLFVVHLFQMSDLFFTASWYFLSIWAILPQSLDWWQAENLGMVISKSTKRWQFQIGRSGHKVKLNIRLVQASQSDQTRGCGVGDRYHHLPMAPDGECHGLGPFWRREHVVLTASLLNCDLLFVYLNFVLCVWTFAYFVVSGTFMYS